jgi:hypothetical protein
MAQETPTAWWKTLLFGLFVIVLGVILFWYFTDFERSGGSRRMNIIVVWLYNLGGKWLASGIFVVLGVLMVGYAVVVRARQR